MSLQLFCTSDGINTGGPNCAPVPGKAAYVAQWTGKIPLSVLEEGYEAVIAGLKLDSKRSKFNQYKLNIFPLVHDITLQKEANIVVTLASGFKQVKREGLPSYLLQIKTDLYIVKQLRKLNNKSTRYAIIDDKNQFHATLTNNGEVIGRSGKFFTEGLDVTGNATVDGQTNVELSADVASETFDFPAVIQLPSGPDGLFAKLKDIQIYEKLASTGVGPIAETKATATMTITTLGVDGNTINVLSPAGSSISGGAVTKTSSESSPTLLATKIAAAITAATSANGGYTAASSGAVITVTAPTGSGIDPNTKLLSATIVGTTAQTNTAFTGGVAAGFTSIVLHLSGKMDSPDPVKVLDFYEDYAASALGTNASLWKVTKSDGTVVTPTSVAPNAAGYFDLTVPGLAAGKYEINTVDPVALDDANILDIEMNPLILVAA